MQLLEKIVALATLYGRQYDYQKAIVVRRVKRLLGLVPYIAFDCKIWISEYGNCWRVMLSEDRPGKPSRTPYIGADFDILDGGRTDAWTKGAENWLPVFDGETAKEIFDRVESALDNAHHRYCELGKWSQ
jgi:hypothetical protein